MQTRALRFVKLAALAAFPYAIIWATSTPPVGRSGAPGDTTCAACHGSTGAGSVQLASTSGLINYTPGATKAFTVTVSGSGGNAGFELTARPASNLTGGVAGNFVAGSTTQAICKAGTTCAAGNPQYIRSVSATTTPATFAFNWVAPTGSEDVTLYLAAVVGYSGNTYLGSYVLKASSGVTPPALSVAPASLSFSYQVGGASPAAQTIAVTASPGTASVTASSSASWLSVSPASGTTPVSVSASVNPVGLAAGVYTGAITVASTGASNTPRSIPVTLNVTAAATSLTVSPASLSFAYQIGGTAPVAKVLAISGATGSYTLASSGGTWLSATPSSGTKSGSSSVSVSTTGLTAGSYSGSVTVTGAGSTGSPKTVPVTLTVTPAAAASLTVSPAALSFAYQIGATAPAAQSIATGGTSLSYTVAVSGGAWLTVSTRSGTTPGTINVSVNTIGMVAGAYNASVTITAPNAVNRTQVVAVNLVVSAVSLQIAPASLSFSYAVGSAAPVAQVINVASSGTLLNYTVTASGEAWLSAAPIGGATPGTLFISVNTAHLAAGTYKASIAITPSNSGGKPQTVPVTLTVTSGGPVCPAS